MIRNCLVLALALLAAGCCLISAPAYGWNSSGHMIVSLIAYDEMQSATQANAVELIRAHPRFKDHFERSTPREVSRGSRPDQARWLFAHASTWPDMVREDRGAVDRNDVNRFHRSWWHFVNQPLFLNDEERRQMEPELRVNLRRDPPDDLDDADMNVIQAIKNSMRIVRDPSQPPQNRAVHLCWLLHLVGDSHQPMHSTALFTTRRFRRGDQGGNLIEIEHDWSLHSFWDAQISTDRPFDTLRILATGLQENEEHVATGRAAANSLDPGAWIDESHNLAKQYVYTSEALEKITSREDHSYLGPLNLPDSYRDAAATVAERRAVEAGYRLARLLEQLLE